MLLELNSIIFPSFKHIANAIYGFYLPFVFGVWELVPQPLYKRIYYTKMPIILPAPNLLQYFTAANNSSGIADQQLKKLNLLRSSFIYLHHTSLRSSSYLFQSCRAEYHILLEKLSLISLSTAFIRQRFLWGAGLCDIVLSGKFKLNLFFFIVTSLKTIMNGLLVKLA